MRERLIGTNDNATVKVAITGSHPPMDYVAADGTPAGFNTAILSEIGKRIGKNIELVQVDSVGRAAALASGTVDVVFWTRGDMIEDGKPLTEDELSELSEDIMPQEDGMEQPENMIPSKDGAEPPEFPVDQDEDGEHPTMEMPDDLSQEQFDIMIALNQGFAPDETRKCDMPEGTINTRPYFKDVITTVILK